MSARVPHKHGTTREPLAQDVPGQVGDPGLAILHTADAVYLVGLLLLCSGPLHTCVPTFWSSLSLLMRPHAYGLPRLSVHS